MEHKLTLTEFSNLLSIVENSYDIKVDDWFIETFILFEDEDTNPIGVLVLPNENMLIFTDSPHSAAAQHGIELFEEARNITWSMLYCY